ERTPSTQGNSFRSIPWPSATSFDDSSGNERRSTLTTRVTTRSATRKDRPAYQCVYQSSSGIRSGRTSGAAKSAYSGTMCATTASGRGRSDAASAASKRTARCARVRAPKRRTTHLSGSAPRAAWSVTTTTSSTRSASARTIGSVAPSAGWSGSAACVMKTSRLTSGREHVVDEPPHAARELVRAHDPAVARRESGGAEALRERTVGQYSDE